MADLKLSEEKLLARVEAAAREARAQIEYRVEEMRREIAEAAEALRTLPDTAAILRDALAVASVVVRNGDGYHDPTYAHPICVGLGNSSMQPIGTVLLPKGSVRVLVIVLPAENAK